MGMRISLFTGEEKRMEPQPATVAALLDIAWDLIMQGKLDLAVVTVLLDHLPIDELDLQAREAISHARMVAVAAQGGSSSHAAVARFGLARVVVLLEKHVAGEASRSGKYLRGV